MKLYKVQKVSGGRILRVRRGTTSKILIGGALKTILHKPAEPVHKAEMEDIQKSLERLAVRKPSRKLVSL